LNISVFFFIYLFFAQKSLILESLDSSFCVKVVISCGLGFCLLVFLHGPK